MSNLTQWLSNEIHSNFPKTVRDLITLPPQGIEGYAYNPLIRAKMLEQLSAIDHWIWLARSTNDLAQFRVCLTYFGDNLIQSAEQDVNYLLCVLTKIPPVYGQCMLAVLQPSLALIIRNSEIATYLCCSLSNEQMFAFLPMFERILLQVLKNEYQMVDFVNKLLLEKQRIFLQNISSRTLLTWVCSVSKFAMVMQHLTGPLPQAIFFEQMKPYLHNLMRNTNDLEMIMDNLNLSQCGYFFITLNQQTMQRIFPLLDDYLIWLFPNRLTYEKLPIKKDCLLATSISQNFIKLHFDQDNTNFMRLHGTLLRPQQHELRALGFAQVFNFCIINNPYGLFRFSDITNIAQPSFQLKTIEPRQSI
ncbi:MAG: hypothetical protein CMF38_08215 [Legionellaceae bacterium]|nr:hypothetical protein [Legionellaceae bacterium]HAF87312.1 hypothetical protein [Legionellales bacterium]HCA89695.1 hypothetical protein [Legionellales bacterium]|tara:strand:+ start:1422 stop:2501 length:1080 start_codon:yes stop_codon:yes gene_type:complete